MIRYFFHDKLFIALINLLLYHENKNKNLLLFGMLYLSVFNRNCFFLINGGFAFDIMHTYRVIQNLGIKI